MSSTLVVGAGLSGLVRAYALSRRGEDVLLLEAGGQPGGVVRTERIGPYLIERGPNTVRPTAELWSLVHDLRLLSQVLIAPARSPRYLDFEGRLDPLPMSPPQLLTTRLLSTRGKLRLLWEPFVRRRGPEAESAWSFFERRLGVEAARRLLEPFVSGIFAGDSAELVASQAFPALTDMEARHGSLLLGALRQRRDRPAVALDVPRGLLSFRDGLRALPVALASELGPRCRLREPARELQPQGSGWRVATDSGVFEAERVVLALPAREAADLARPFAPEAAGRLSEIPSPALALLHLSWPLEAFAIPPVGFGYLVVPQPQRRILGCLWTSSLFAGRAPEGRALLTVFLGGRKDPNALAFSDQELVEVATADLRAALGVRGAPELVALTRWERSIPQYGPGHAACLEALARAEASHPGLVFLGNYRGGISVGDVVKNALSPIA